MDPETKAILDKVNPDLRGDLGKALEGLARLDRQVENNRRYGGPKAGDSLEVTRRIADAPFIDPTDEWGFPDWPRERTDDLYARINDLAAALIGVLDRRVRHWGAIEVSFGLVFLLRAAPGGPAFAVEGATYRRGYDPEKARLEAEAYNANAHGFDRALTFRYTWTEGGRTLGYFNERTRSALERQYELGFGSRPDPKAPLFLAGLRATAFPSNLQRMQEPADVGR